MKRWSRCTMLVVTILMVLALSAMWAVPVLADDETPPPAETQEVVPPPQEEPPAEEPVVAEEPPATEEVAPEEPAVEETPAPLEEEPLEVPAATEEPVLPTEQVPATQEVPASESSTPPAETSEEILEQLPEGTEIMVVDENGDALSLATQAAADAITFIDPIWCPVGVAPRDGTGGCTPSYGSLFELIDAIFTNAIVEPGTNGVIWIQAGADASDTPIVLDGLDPAIGNWENFSLTLKGGWNGTFGSTITNSATPSVIDVPLSIINWRGDITLSDIVIAGTSGAGYALDVDTTKNINLTRVEVTGNAGSGARLDNTASGAGTGNVAITSGKFNNNLGGRGLEVWSRGTITLSTVSANGNNSDGAYLHNDSAATAKAVTLTSGLYEFNNNGTDNGLSVWSKGAIALKDITAVNNGLYGAYLDNCLGGTPCANPFASAITLSGTNVFSENDSAGLFVQSSGAIKTNSLIANGNGTIEAVLLDNDGATSAQPVTLTGTNEFKFNYEGLRIISKGAVTLNNVTATHNMEGGGVLINNTASGHLVPQNVTLTGYGIFNSNSANGLSIVTYGAIAAANVEANNNERYGVLLNNHGDNGAGGLDPSFGDGYATLVKAVTLSVSGSNPAMEINNNYSGGLYIFSLGAISLNPVNATGNGWDCSAAPDPCTPVANAHGVFLKNNYSNAVGGITISGWASTGNNGGSGLKAYSKGVITLTDLWTWGNQNYGAFLDNTSGTGAVMISGSTGHWGNTWDGLTILSKGAITLVGTVTANNNDTGVILDNTASGTDLPQNVTLNGASHEFNWNEVNGLEISSYGMITLNNLYANGNQGFGALIDNCLQSVPGSGTCTVNTAKPITLNGDNTFEWNDSNGLDLTSKGIITVNNLIARDNGGFGAFFDNRMTGTTAAITVKNTSTFSPEFSRNGLDGLRLTSNGTITVMDLEAYENGQAGDPDYGYGVYLNNTKPDGTGTGNIILGTSRINWQNGLGNNFLSGLEVYTNGTVTLSNLRANDNGSNGNGYGVYVDNSNSSVSKAVTLKGNSEFNNDWNAGLYILSKGVITLNNITANENGNGVYLNNTASGSNTPQNITLTGFGDFFNNWSNGLEVNTYGIITLNNVNARNNGQRSYACELSGECDPDSGSGYGAYLYNAGATAAAKPAVILNGNNDFRNNADFGLQIDSLGAIAVNNLNANDNGVWWNCTESGCATVIPAFGAWLNNSGAGAKGGVTLTSNTYTYGNSDYGLQIDSLGAITITANDMWVGNNGGFGWNLDNHLGSGGVTLTTPAANMDRTFDFWNNGGYGLWIQSRGNITISGLDSNNNGWDTGNGWGAYLDNAFPDVTGTITLLAPARGGNDFSGNFGDGLLVYSNRAITVGKLSTNDNGQDCSTDPCTRLPGNGAVLDNTSSGSGLPQNITLTGFGDFHNNGSNGLTALSYGIITISNINASDNGQYNFWAQNQDPALPTDPAIGWGVYLDNCNFVWDFGTPSNSGCTHTSTAPKGITITGSNSSNNNFQDGLWATSLGAISVKQLSAANNGGDGAYLDNSWDGAVGGVTLISTTNLDWNSFGDNGRGYDNGWTLSVGLEIFSRGAITLNNISANNNEGGGAYLDNTSAVLPQVVSLTGRSVFNNNGGDGLAIDAYGNININSMTAKWNNGDGADLDNCLWDGGLSACTGLGNITLTGVNNFSENANDGLYADTHGSLTLTKVTADGNGGRGVYGGADGNITLTCGSMTRNGIGWSFGSLGTVRLTGVFAYGNTTNTDLWNGTLVPVRTCSLP